MSADTLDTVFGPAPVLHRLALGLLTHDVLTGGATGPGVRVGWEASGHLLPRGSAASWPCVDFERSGDNRFRLRTGRARPGVLTVRIDDPTRRQVPRRLRIVLWPTDRLAAEPPGAVVPVGLRTIPVSLFPGATYPLVRGTTAIRGRVTQAGVPVRWARLAALDAGDVVLGRAQGDDRGEFLLVITDANQNPVQSEVDVRLVVHAPSVGSVEPVVEIAQLAGAPPPLPGAPDLATLKGNTLPPGYLPNAAPATMLTVPVGAQLVPSTDIPFHP